MTKDEARKELLETLEEYCHDKGYNFQVFAGMSDWVYTLYPEKKTMTNRQWLVSLSDDELARWLDHHIADCCVCSHKKGYSCDIPDEGYDCENGRREWLKQEHEDEND